MIRRVQPPLGLCCVAANLRDKGIKNILIYDTIIEDYSDVRKLKDADDMITYGSSDDKILKSKPDYALLLAWNFSKEIINNNIQYLKKGGKFIIPIPNIKIISHKKNEKNKN